VVHPSPGIADKDSFEFVNTKDADDVDESVETPIDLQIYMDKVALYSKHLYVNARQKEGGGKGVKKYTRKLRRLTQRFQESQTKLL
jgi:hypothetical protein